MCQRPRRAFFISTKNGLKMNTRTQKCVNALDGLFSFLHRRKSDHSNGLWVCQRPRRAFFISTVPSYNQHKYWLPRPVSADSCLNILTKTVFLHFFGMLILCSYFRLFILLLFYYTLNIFCLKVFFIYYPFFLNTDTLTDYIYQFIEKIWKE